MGLAVTAWSGQLWSGGLGGLRLGGRGMAWCVLAGRAVAVMVGLGMEDGRGLADNGKRRRGRAVMVRRAWARQVALGRRSWDTLAWRRKAWSAEAVMAGMAATGWHWRA